MTLIPREEFAKLITRPGLDNWLVVGAQVRCVRPEVLKTAWKEGKAHNLRYSPLPNLSGVHVVVALKGARANENWLRFQIEGSRWWFSPEKADGTVVWEPAD